MKKYNLHIVRSPLQLINILEAIETLSLKNNILVVIDRKNEANSVQIQAVLNAVDYKWEKVFTIKKSSNSNLLAYVKLIKEIRVYEFINIFIGDIDTISNVIIANLKHEKVFLVDDGTSTLKRHETLLKKPKFSLQGKIKLLRFKLFGLKAFKKYQVNFFTFFDLKQKLNEIIIKNEFKNLKKKFALSNEGSNKVYILGQPLYNKEISEDDFIIHLKKILDYYSDKELIYLKHRYETPTEKILTLLKGRATIYENKYPIELDFLLKKEYPKFITGFFSTGLYTLNMMYSEADIKAFYMNKTLFFDKDRAEVVDNYYNFFAENKIEIIR